jgi:hypothetical protein
LIQMLLSAEKYHIYGYARSEFEIAQKYSDRET